MKTLSDILSWLPYSIRFEIVNFIYLKKYYNYRLIFKRRVKERISFNEAKKKANEIVMLKKSLILEACGVTEPAKYKPIYEFDLVKKNSSFYSWNFLFGEAVIIIDKLNAGAFFIAQGGIKPEYYGNLKLISFIYSKNRNNIYRFYNTIWCSHLHKFPVGWYEVKFGSSYKVFNEDNILVKKMSLNPNDYPLKKPTVFERIMIKIFSRFSPKFSEQVQLLRINNKYLPKKRSKNIKGEELLTFEEAKQIAKKYFKKHYKKRVLAINETVIGNSNFIFTTEDFYFLQNRYYKNTSSGDGILVSRIDGEIFEFHSNANIQAVSYNYDFIPECILDRPLLENRMVAVKEKIPDSFWQKICRRFLISLQSKYINWEEL